MGFIIKFIATISFFQVNLVSSSFQKIQQDIDRILAIEQILIKTGGDSEMNNSIPQPRSLLNTFNLIKNNDTQQNMIRTIYHSDMKELDRYGCWCYFETDHGKGKGNPVNKIDQVCKTLHDSYTCAVKDSEYDQTGLFGMNNESQANSICIPWQVDYNSALGMTNGFISRISVEMLQSECDRTNDSLCARAACKAEGWFVVQFITYVLEGNVIDDNYKHSNEQFNPDDKCPKMDTIIMNYDMQCCGQQPLRYPYKTINGDRACCNDRTYNTALQQCCDDGKVRIAC